MSDIKTMSGDEFKKCLKPLLDSLHDDDEVFFGSGNISFYRVKERGPLPSGRRLVQVEFNEMISVSAEPDQ